MKRATHLSLTILFIFASTCLAQIVPPKPGVEMPQAYFDRVAKDKNAFQFKNAWIQKAERVRNNRRAFLAANGNLPPMELLSAGSQPELVVAGNINVPVFMAKFANTGSAPYPSSNLQTELFDGPWPTGTMSQLYGEMSYGNLSLGGTAYNWVTVSQNDTYYEGGCAGLCGSAKTGQFILEVLTAHDGAVDFGQYDNDGPDGVPNSGDDDGFVDFVAFVHPEIGAECGPPNQTNLWSHRWVVQGWPEFAGSPWSSNDAASGGGFIKVQDYTIQPALGCGGSMIEIGVFCHEFGHAFGLPDLYDTDGGGEGIGHHGLMGSGNWNTPTNPAHISAWSKMQLGWVNPVAVGPTSQLYAIDNVDQNASVFQLNIMEEKFKRSNVNPISGSYSLRCGLNNTEAANRNWNGSGGYGNGWREQIRRDFSYDGTNPVTLQYDVQYDTEANYDYARIKIKVNGTTTTVRTYTGFGLVNNAVVDLTAYLNGSGATSYQIIAELASDPSYSDEDGLYNSGTNGPFKLDNISVTGGGENYSTDFEQYEDGWYHDFNENPNREFFLVENRSRTGQFDQGLYSEGLMIWHIEQNVIKSSMRNTGGTNGTTDLLPAGVMLEEADAMRHLLLGMNRGDTGDACPGSSNSTKFDNTTTPSSMSHNGVATNVLVDNVSAPAAQMTATMRAGWFAPTLSAITPNTGDASTVIPISDLAGTGMVHGSTFLLRDASLNEYSATNVEWVGKTKLTGDLNLSGVPYGTHDVVVRMPDGQEAVLAGGFTVNAPAPVLIQAILAEVEGSSIRLTWDVWSDEAISGFNILRRESNASNKQVINPSMLSSSDREYVDDSPVPGQNYEYSLLVVMGDGDELLSRPIPAQTAGLALELFQNDPNPFNPQTKIRFALPAPTTVNLAVYDLEGKLIATLTDGPRPAGTTEVLWDGRNTSGAQVATGVYFYRLRAGKTVLTKKLVVLK